MSGTNMQFCPICKKPETRFVEGVCRECFHSGPTEWLSRYWQLKSENKRQLELIGEIAIERDRLQSELAEANKEIERLREVLEFIDIELDEVANVKSAKFFIQQALKEKSDGTN